ncbi:MAG: LytTR family transcriptional regulator DNA-binding domain-containing protein [Chitinophaga sp.]|uniref:LytTR family transcriptional regulator DNA-binding domain-containing protein n=1 Tax=Chitinophaga sp. TaxID=1869181 RepID=UPI0025C3CDEC|nr:LytTR family transcriptional regulator DNA-binding domain-containing protein [Chitinophaga sp.]MBV8252529.1 LytTR family transcriptional regulator DNA-binding domain-containing protein [Chitinophaga sp.]
MEKVFVLMPQRPEEKETDYIVVHSSYQELKINTHRIKYIERLKDYLRIRLHDAPPVMTLMILKKMVDHLPTNRFSRIHRSFIVAVREI